MFVWCGCGNAFQKMYAIYAHTFSTIYESLQLPAGENINVTYHSLRVFLNVSNGNCFEYLKVKKNEYDLFWLVRKCNRP